MKQANTTTDLRQSFHYGFQISRSIVFEVSYYRCGNNQDKYFTTSAAEFNRPKTDFNQCGQAQKDLLRFAAKAMRFYKKWDELHLKDLTDDQYNDLRIDIEDLKKQYNFIEVFADSGLNFSDLKDLSKQPVKRFNQKQIKPRFTPEQKAERAEQRRKEKEVIRNKQRIEDEKKQNPVKEITFSIEWKKSRMWGYNPTCEAQIRHKDGSFSTGISKCSGCGYDKESTVIADIFNQFLKYKLYQPIHKTDRSRDNGLPYGIYLDEYRHFSGGIGTDCYYSIAQAIGGKFEKVASGKSFDVYKYTDLI